ncbi:MAG: urease accessory protein UreF [Betaproteobacteria bacterium]|nr:urease accessory protein UreF [Betaproteobacteria bacterium]
MVITTNNLARLLQLVSPTLPVGAYSYSQGLEAALEAGIIRDRATALQWIGNVLELAAGTMEAPVLARLCRAWSSGDMNEICRWNDQFLASRETAELRAETVQMGYSLRRLIVEVAVIDQPSIEALNAIEEVSFPAAFACVATAMGIDPHQTLLGYLWSWCENQVMAVVKALPLGQTDGQRLLLALGERLPAIASAAMLRPDELLSNFAPGLAILSSRHETQYSRLFRS